MTQALQDFLSCRDEHAEITGIFSLVNNAVHICRNGQAAGTVALGPADIARLKAYELPIGISNPIGWYIQVLSEQPATVDAPAAFI